MKSILTITMVAVLLAGLVAMATAADVLDLSTLNRKPTLETVSLPQVSPTMPTIAPTALGGNATREVLDLSTLGKKAPSVAATEIRGATPVTVTPMFSIKNKNVTVQAGSVFTLPQAITSNATVYTPPIAIFGGA